MKKIASDFISKMPGITGIEKELSLVQGDKDEELAKLESTIHQTIWDTEKIYND